MSVDVSGGGLQPVAELRTGINVLQYRSIERRYAGGVHGIGRHWTAGVAHASCHQPQAHIPIGSEYI